MCTHAGGTRIEIGSCADELGPQSLSYSRDQVHQWDSDRPSKTWSGLTLRTNLHFAQVFCTKPCRLNLAYEGVKAS